MWRVHDILEKDNKGLFNYCWIILYKKIKAEVFNAQNWEKKQLKMSEKLIKIFLDLMKMFSKDWIISKNLHMIFTLTFALTLKISYCI